MSNTEKLLFFNKEGYPYNFRLNDGIWTGKLFLEPNSTGLYKTQSIYTLEEVNPIEYSGEFNIINNEIYNNSGMTISHGDYYDEDLISITEIKKVNESPDFYTKWVHGENINTKYKKGTIISFINGFGDFSPDKIFTILSTKKDAIMIATSTDNASTSSIIVNDMYAKSYSAISIPDFGRDLPSSFTPTVDEKISLVGSDDNDGVYEICGLKTTKTRIFDFDLSSYNNIGDVLTISLELLTERPTLYVGNIDVDVANGKQKITFTNGRNSNISLGTEVIFEDDNGEHLLDSNFYTIDYIYPERLLYDNIEIILSSLTYIEDDLEEIFYYVLLPNNTDVKIGNKLKFNGSDDSNQKNNGLVKKVTNIQDYELSGETYKQVFLESKVYDDKEIYTVMQVLKSHEQNIVDAIPSINLSGQYSGFTRCMSTSNKLIYTQEILDDSQSDVIGKASVIESIDAFIIKYSNIFEFNGVDIYRDNETLIFEGRYSGQNPYFNVVMTHENSPIIPQNDYSDNEGNTDVFNILLKENTLTYERKNKSDELAVSYYADIILDLSDDAQDYGFQITLNGVQYYISFNDDEGLTTNTLETIKDFVSKYYTIFKNNGIELTYGTTVENSITLNHLYLNGHEPNVDVWEMLVKVNKNSTYILNEIPNNSMMITSNQLETSDVNLIDLGYSTGMIVSIIGSDYSLNNKEYNIIGIFDNKIELSYQGALYNNENVNLTIKSREYLRRPRETNDSDIVYRYRWEDDQVSELFLYDLSGDNLKPHGDNDDYKYVGVKPLVANDDFVILNTEPNKNKEWVNLPYKQQTVFSELEYTLERFDDDNISLLPKPIQTHIAYNSDSEGVNYSNLIIEREDNVNFSGYADGYNLYFEISGDEIKMTTTQTHNFLELGFKVGRSLRMKFDDNRPYTQEIFEDYHDYDIINVTPKTIKINGSFTSFTTKDSEFDFEIKLLPQIIANFSIYGETEEEDERYEANLKLLGVSLTEEDEFIFKSSDITEDGIDYRLLNRKRKEMLNVYPDIFNYVGSYRAILNSIDFFGYNDVELVEYYRNINEDSPLYNKMKRSIIPQLHTRDDDDWIYVNELEGNAEYVKTNLFNLTYRITDEYGSNVYLYTLKEAQTKLNGLKKWLRRNVIPVNSNVRDITGVSEAVGTVWRRHDTINIIKNNIFSSTEGVNINYTATRNFNDNWLVSVRFYTISGEVPDYWDLKVITFKKDEDGKLHPQQRWDELKVDLNNFNFSINWDDDEYDRYFYVETTRYNDMGMSKSISKMYNLEDDETYYFDEWKNYMLVNNNFKYKKYPYIQNKTNIYVIDEDGNFWVIKKESPIE